MEWNPFNPLINKNLQRHADKQAFLEKLRNEDPQKDQGSLYRNRFSACMPQMAREDWCGAFSIAQTMVQK